MYASFNTCDFTHIICVKTSCYKMNCGPDLPQKKLGIGEKV